MRKEKPIQRYSAPERINHWIVAFCFVFAAISGLGFFFPSFNWLMNIFGTPQLARILHPFVGVIMFAAFLLMFLRYWKHNLINREDIVWAKNIHKIAMNEEVGDTGRYNFGQKCVFWAAIISFGAAAGQRRGDLAAIFCAVVLHPADPHRAAGAFAGRGRPDYRDYGAHLRRIVGKRHHYRDGGRLGAGGPGQETSSALVP